MEKLINETATASTVVAENNTAEALKSGDLPVFSTPSMIALMEEASVKLIKNSLLDSESSVGTYLNIKHTKASPIGENIEASSKLIEINKKELTFEVSAKDNKGEIGRGIHKRFIVDREHFLIKL